MEKLLKKIGKSQAFAPNDRLSAMVDKYARTELNDGELDMVFAARKADYEEFLAAMGEDEE